MTRQISIDWTVRGERVQKTFVGASNPANGASPEAKLNDYVNSIVAQNISDCASVFNKREDYILQRVLRSSQPWLARFIHNMLIEDMETDESIDRWIARKVNYDQFQWMRMQGWFSFLYWKETGIYCDRAPRAWRRGKGIRGQGGSEDFDVPEDQLTFLAANGIDVTQFIKV